MRNSNGSSRILTLNIRTALVLSSAQTFHYSVRQQSCGSSVLADGRLADLIRRVATFGMVLMKLDVRQVHIMKTTAFACSASKFPIGNYKRLGKVIRCCRNLVDTQKLLMLSHLIWILAFIVSGMKKRSWIS